MSKKYHINTKPYCSWSDDRLTSPPYIENNIGNYIGGKEGFIEVIIGNHIGDEEELNAIGTTTNEVKKSIKLALESFFLDKKYKENAPTIPDQKEDIHKLSETLNELVDRLSNMPPVYRANLKSTLLVGFKKNGFLHKIKDDLCLLQSAIECTEKALPTTQRTPERDILIYRLAKVFDDNGGRELKNKAEFIGAILTATGENVPKDKIRMITRVNSLKLSDYF